jgi:serine/threonine-protein kinase RsbW
VPEEVADPLAPENILKSSGRGIFIIRTFMDEMVLRRAPEGGMEVVMVKRIAADDHADSQSPLP